jgi:hypothetical protein
MSGIETEEIEKAMIRNALFFGWGKVGDEKGRANLQLISSLVFYN